MLVEEYGRCHYWLDNASLKHNYCTWKDDCTSPNILRYSASQIGDQSLAVQGRDDLRPSHSLFVYSFKNEII